MNTMSMRIAARTTTARSTSCRHFAASNCDQSLQRLFWVSSTSVYGQDDGSIVDEHSAAAPTSATAQVLLASEALAQTAPWPTTVVRCSGLYGPGRVRLLRWVEEGRAVQAEPPSWTNRLHVDDAASILTFLIVRSLAGMTVQDLYIATDPASTPQHEVLDWIADTMKVSRVSHEARQGGRSNKRLSSERLARLGYVWEHPDFRSGYRSVISSWNARGS
jgi:nucleoside-diphosphate-sugar epimerase